MMFPTIRGVILMMLSAMLCEFGNVLGIALSAPFLWLGNLVGAWGYAIDKAHVDRSYKAWQASEAARIALHEAEMCADTRD